jgi:hypothetical protein
MFSLDFCKRIEQSGFILSIIIVGYPAYPQNR